MDRLANGRLIAINRSAIEMAHTRTQGSLNRRTSFVWRKFPGAHAEQRDGGTGAQDDARTTGAFPTLRLRHGAIAARYGAITARHGAITARHSVFAARYGAATATAATSCRAALYIAGLIAGLIAVDERRERRLERTDRPARIKLPKLCGQRGQLCGSGIDVGHGLRGCRRIAVAVQVLRVVHRARERCRAFEARRRLVRAPEDI